MFYNCNNLRNLDLSFIITKNVIDIDGIFNGCSNEIINSNIYKDINENNLKSVKGC
jgi:surface protein